MRGMTHCINLRHDQKFAACVKLVKLSAISVYQIDDGCWHKRNDLMNLTIVRSLKYDKVNAILDHFR